MIGSSPGRPGPYSCALAALNRARSRYDAAARVFKPAYHHNEGKLTGREPLTQAEHTAAMRRMQWHKAWIEVGEAAIRSHTSEYQKRTGSWCSSDGT